MSFFTLCLVMQVNKTEHMTRIGGKTKQTSYRGLLGLKVAVGELGTRLVTERVANSTQTYNRGCRKLRSEENQ